MTTTPPPTRGLIFGVQRFSTEDGPGIRTTVFLKGCPMRCPWCQNPEGLRAGAIDLLWSKARCLGDGACERACPRGAIRRTPSGLAIDRARCAEEAGCAAPCADACPTGALERAGTERAADELVEELCRDRAFYASSGGGVTLSGGEPAAQPAFAAEVLDRLGAAGIHRALDTCGAVGPRVLEELLLLRANSAGPARRRVDLVLYDLKLMDERRHRELTGIALERVLENARRVAASGVPVWIRTPIIPGSTDAPENVSAIARFIREAMAGAVERWDLLAFSRLCVSKYERLGIAPEQSPAALPSVERAHMERLRAVALESGVADVVWSGMTTTTDEGHGGGAAPPTTAAR